MEESNLEKAKRLYSKGVVFKAIGEDSDNVYTSDGVFERIMDVDSSHLDSIMVKGYVFVYNSHLDKWAEILPQEETLEELEKPIGGFVLENAISIKGKDGYYYHYSEVCKLLKLQTESMYSEEEVLDILFKHTEYFVGFGERVSLTEWFEKFKKKYMNIQEFTKKTFTIQHGMVFRPVIICNDGFSFSAQASRNHYCLPRENQEQYESMELGFPSEDEPLIFEYAEESNEWTSTVYVCVPNDVINNIIEKHGGINLEETFKN